MDEKARRRFEQMYQEYEGTVRRLAYGYNIPVDYIDDIVQDTFVSYAQYDYSLEQTETGKRILLGRIVKSRCVDYRRRLENRTCEDVDNDDFIIEDFRIQNRKQSIPEYVASKERCIAILDAIENMPDNWQKVANLKLIQGRPTEEVCQILNISEKACYSRVSRIRKYMETLLGNEMWP